jgi:hypothetical protein
MVLTPQDAELFFKLHRALMFFVNQRLRVLPDDVASPEEFSSLSPEVRLKVRNAFLKYTDLIESFAEENPAHLTSDELDIVRSWRHPVHGKFYVLRQLNKHMVLLSADKQPVAYGVLALSQPFEELVGPSLPVPTETVLLPFKGLIVYDGLMSSSPRAASGSGSSTNTTSATHGVTKFSSRAVSNLKRERSTRCAWRANGPAHRKTWAASGATLTSWKPSRTRRTDNTTRCWNGSEVASTRKPSMRRRRRGR